VGEASAAVGVLAVCLIVAVPVCVVGGLVYCAGMKQSSRKLFATLCLFASNI
jgi:hypothetical protein